MYIYIYTNFFSADFLQSFLKYKAAHFRTFSKKVPHSFPLITKIR